jgi:hypothetical protein
MSVPTRRTTLQHALEERLNVIGRITAVFKRSCSGTVPSQSWDCYRASVSDADARVGVSQKRPTILILSALKRQLQQSLRTFAAFPIR